MAKFYFTYGATDNMPFIGGWTEIEAPNLTAAVMAFRLFHPDRNKGIVNCSFIYTEEQFKKTDMSGADGNYYRHCHERISVTRELLDEVTA